MAVGYLDPGSGSALVQTIAAFFAKIGKVWDSLTALFRKKD